MIPRRAGGIQDGPPSLQWVHRLEVHRGVNSAITIGIVHASPEDLARLRLAGLWDRCASVRASGMSTLEVDRDPQAAIRAVVAEARKAVELDRAEVICLGCGGMAGLEDAITSELHVPVFDGVGAAVRLAEALVGLGLKTSKISTYALPEPKTIIAWPLSVALNLRQDGSQLAPVAGAAVAGAAGRAES